MEYDFSKLNDREFEALGASVIGKILNKRIETFKSGRDGVSMADSGLVIKKGLSNVNIILKHHINN